MKRNYIQPSVTVAQVALDSMILTGSGDSSNTMSTFDTITNDQW